MTDTGKQGAEENTGGIIEAAGYYVAKLTNMIDENGDSKKIVAAASAMGPLVAVYVGSDSETVAAAFSAATMTTFITATAMLCAAGDRRCDDTKPYDGLAKGLKKAALFVAFSAVVGGIGSAAIHHGPEFFSQADRPVSTAAPHGTPAPVPGTFR